MSPTTIQTVIGTAIFFAFVVPAFLFGLAGLMDYTAEVIDEAFALKSPLIWCIASIALLAGWLALSCITFLVLFLFFF